MENLFRGEPKPPKWIWIFQKHDWNPDLVDREEEKYVKFLFYKWMEKLHFKTSAPFSLPLFSTLGLLKLIRWDYFWIAPRLGSKEIPACKLGTLFTILEGLKIRLKHECWLHHDYPDIINALKSGIDKALTSLDEYIEKIRKSGTRPGKSPWSIEITKIGFETDPSYKEFNDALDELNKALNGEVERYEGIAENILQRQRELLVQLIEDRSVDHWVKLELIDNYLTEYLRDLIHYGHSMDYLYRWLHGYVMGNRETIPEWRKETLTKFKEVKYLDRFAKFPGICEGDKKYKVFLQVKFPLSVDLALISTSKVEFYHGFPSPFTEYRGYEYIRKWHEEEKDKPEKMNESFWVATEIFAKDPVQAASAGSTVIRRYSNLISKLKRYKKIDPERISLQLCGNPIVANIEEKTIEAISNPRPFDWGSYKNIGMLFKTRDEWLKEGKTYDETTFNHIETVLDWILQAATGGYRGIRQSIFIPAETSYISLWTAMERLFTEKVNFFEYLPCIVVLSYPFIVLDDFHSQLRHFHTQRQIELPEDIMRLKVNDFLDRLKESFFKTDGLYQLVAKEAFLEYSLKRCVKLHPTTAIDQNGKLQPQSSSAKNSIKPALLGEIEDLFKTTKANLTILREIRNLLVHREVIQIDQNLLYLLIKNLSFYLTLSVDTLIYRYRVKRYEEVKGLFEDIRATYGQMHKCLQESKLDSYLLIKPYRISSEIKKGRLFPR